MDQLREPQGKDGTGKAQNDPLSQSSLISPSISYKKTANQTDPLVKFQLNNPIPPIRRLLKKLFSNEEITIKIPILTAIAIVAFGLGGASGFLTALKIELANRIPLVASVFPTPTPTVTPNYWVQTTLFGTLSKQTNGDFYLILEKGDVIKVVAPANVSLDKLVGKKILATGQYHKELNEMKVTEASDLLQINSSTAVPTEIPTQTPEPTPNPSITPSPTPAAINY